ncbi:hypothetical protein LHYA1_G009143 [Lachnellula hyalina]|uniref:Uncharacterized protein n=1 Tax=Lachnellula hyalina TaxID=1316788 RepID=A0A8H8TWN2_9HELO|nr:uncharacterized protein LHYA1_G009143 [Lachnellula hyalina]TVY22136.1 hypothetical protein LHYA1_G009143 [Lachnellula hyalina]
MSRDVSCDQIRDIAHRIPTSVFNYPEGIELVKDEIRTFNKAENRLKQIAGSVAIAFATPKEASAAV